MGFNSAFKGLKQNMYICVVVYIHIHTHSTYTHTSSLCKYRPIRVSKKGTAIPLQAWTDPKGYKRLRFPNFKTIGTHEGGKVVSPKHRPPLPPRKYFWYSFLLEAESTPGP